MSEKEQSLSEKMQDHLERWRRNRHATYAGKRIIEDVREAVTRAMDRIKSQVLCCKTHDDEVIRIIEEEFGEDLTK